MVAPVMLQISATDNTIKFHYSSVSQGAATFVVTWLVSTKWTTPLEAVRIEAFCSSGVTTQMGKSSNRKICLN